MVVFMVKMSFTKLSDLDADENRREITFMDREVASGWFDYFRLTQDFKFRNYEHNCPDPENSEEPRSDATEELSSLVSSYASQPDYY